MARQRARHLRRRQGHRLDRRNAGTGAAFIQDPWRDDDMLLKFTSQGKFLLQIGHREQTGGNKDTKNLKEPADASSIGRPMSSLSPTVTEIAG